MVCFEKETQMITDLLSELFKDGLVSEQWYYHFRSIFKQMHEIIIRHFFPLGIIHIRSKIFW